MYALAQEQNICFEKMAGRLGLIILALAVFSGGGMQLNAGESTINYYIQNEIKQKEQTNALFLLKKQWNSEIKQKYKLHKVREISDGIVYVGITKNIKSRKIKINVAEINRNINPNIEIAPKMASNKLHARSKINNIAGNTKIAVNGTYFKQDTGTPLGTLVINNKIITGPIYERVGLGIGKNGFKTSRIAFTGKIKKGEREIKINNINQPRMLFSQVLLYTNVWGEKSPLTKAQTKHIAVKGGIITAISNNPVLIPKNGYVISAPKEKVQGLKLGDKIEITYGITPKWKGINHIISGGPYLVKDGQIYIDVKSEKFSSITGRNPRTAIGYTKNNVLIMVTVDGRKEGTTGVTLTELASIMKHLGCYEAINLDGGSSTVMYVDGNVISGSNIKNSAAISNALTVRVKA